MKCEKKEIKITTYNLELEVLEFDEILACVARAARSDVDSYKDRKGLTEASMDSVSKLYSGLCNLRGIKA